MAIPVLDMVLNVSAIAVELFEVLAYETRLGDLTKQIWRKTAFELNRILSYPKSPCRTINKMFVY